MSSSPLTEAGRQPRQSVSLIVAPSPLSLQNSQKMHPGNFEHLKNPTYRQGQAFLKLNIFLKFLGQ